MKALQESRWADAATHFSEIIKVEPKDYAAHFHLAFARTMMGQQEQAIASYRTVLELKPDLFEARLNLGMLLTKTDAKEEARRLLEAAREQKPDDKRLHLYLGRLYLETKEHDKAEASYRSALAAGDGGADVLAGLALALTRAGKLDEAEAAYRKAAAIDPGYRDGLLELAGLHEKARRFERAISLYREFPDNVAARERMGELLLESGQAETAIPELEAAMAASPTPANKYALALAYNAQKQYSKSEPLLEKILAADASNFDVRMTYARVLREQRKFEPAAQQFYRAAQVKPDSAAAWSDLAGMLILSEQYGPALAALDKVRALGAETAAHHYFRALVLDKHNLNERALASYEEFLRLSEGKHPDEEFKARQRVRILKRELEKR
jgi:tetratricopeptide (TPR) repeat protein